MNIRDVHGVSSQQELYELATVDHKLHAGSMDSLIRFAIELQRRALANSALKEETTDIPAIEPFTNLECGCHKCLEGKMAQGGFFPLSMTRMILCETCGNKRCPHATDHRLVCTNSNDPGQPGSKYGPPLEEKC